jgi:thioesterase domain-containing protein
LPQFDVYALQAKGLDRHHLPHLSVEEMACSYIDEVRKLQPHGALRILGYSFGGVVALEMARQLAEKGEKVAFLGILDRAAPNNEEIDSGRKGLSKAWDVRTTRLRFLARVAAARGLLSARLPVPFMKKIYKTALNTMNRNYSPRSAFSGSLAIFQTEELRSGGVDPVSEKGWGRLVRGTIKIYPAPGTHHTLLEEPHVQILAGILEKAIAEA